MTTDAASTSSTSRRLPAEWESGGAVMLAWPHEDTDWAPLLSEARACYGRLARAIVDAGEIALVVTPRPEEAMADMDAAGVDPARRLIVELPTNDTWTRDYGPITVALADGSPLMLDYGFNGWGLKFAACHDNLAASRLHALHALTGRMLCRREMILEGGSIESDGQGTLMVTSRCLLSPNRNPQMSRADIEAALAADLGVTNFVWLDHGDIPGDDTDGHIDTLARFAPGNVILFSAPASRSHPLMASVFEPMIEQLTQARDAHGNHYCLMQLPMPEPPLLDPDDGHELPATYANFLVTRRAVIMPTYNRPQSDAMAAMILRQAFPAHELIEVDCSALVRQHGSLHCATMQLPAQCVCI